MNNSTILGLLVLAIGISTMPVFAESNDVSNTPNNLQDVSTHNSITLDWDDSSNESVTGYKILSRTTGQAELSVLIPNTGSSESSYVVENLIPSTTYVFKVVAINEFGESLHSEPILFSSLHPPVAITTPPSKPTNLVAISYNNSIHLTWHNPSTEFITGYKILSRTSDELNMHTLIQNTGSSQSSRIFDSLIPGTTYIFKVIAINHSGESPPSDPVHLSIPSDAFILTPIDPHPDIPAKPTKLVAIPTNNSITLDWGYPSDNSITGYKIISKNYTTPSLYALVPNTGNSKSYYTVENLIPNTHYLFYVVAINEFGESFPSKQSALTSSDVVKSKSHTFVKKTTWGGFFDTLTIKSKPIIIPPYPLNEFYKEPKPLDDSEHISPMDSCILPSSISVQIPHNIPIGGTFDVVVTPSFELTWLQLIQYKINGGSNIDNVRDLWNQTCSGDGHYLISYPRFYLPSGDNVSYSDAPYPRHIKPTNDYTSKLNGLNFDGTSTTFQMTIVEDQPTITMMELKCAPYFTPDHFSIISLNPNSLTNPVYVYTSGDCNHINLSEHEFWWSPLFDYFMWIYQLFIQFLYFLLVIF